MLGTALGSFVSMASYRIPRFISWRGRSFCDICHKPLAASELIPIISWVIHRGRCSCGLQPISIRYPLIELGMGLTCAGAAVIFGFSWTLLVAIIFSTVFAILLTIRIEYPDSRPRAQAVLGLITLSLAGLLVLIKLSHS